MIASILYPFAGPSGGLSLPNETAWRSVPTIRIIPVEHLNRSQPA